MDDARRVLVVDDDAGIRELVGTALGYEGYEVQTVDNGLDAVRVVERFVPDLVVLDIMLPDLDGYAVLRRITESVRAPAVLFLSARDQVEDRIRGLALGADDYLTKPFSVGELVARVDAVLRRSAPRSDRRVIQVADLVIDEDAATVTRAGEPIELTPTEFKLLVFLAENPGRVLSKVQIMEAVWEYDFGGDGNIVETYVSYLRRKVDRGRQPLIRTVRGFGYTIRPGDDRPGDPVGP